MSNELTPFNPLTKRHLAGTIVSKLLKQPAMPLPPSERFNGAGIYLIYYSGPFPIYRAISEANRASHLLQPIYVGKAIPKGGRKGSLGFDSEHGPVLFKRLNEHAESIVEATNLELSDFQCRCLCVEDFFIPLAETLLISHYRPLWNLMAEGFGNHQPGKGRKDSKKPLWDVVHPGRRWAANLATPVSEAHVVEKINRHVASTSIPAAPLEL